MKANIKGSVGKKEILEFLARCLNTLEDAGVTDFKGVNLYFNPYIAGNKVTPSLEGNEIEFTHTSNESHIKFDTVESGMKVATYVTHIKGVNIDLDTRFNLEPKIELPTEIELIAKRSALTEAREAKQRASTEAYYKSQKKEKALREAEREVEKKCIEIVISTLDIPEIEFKNLKPNKNWLTTIKGIKRYTDKDIGNSVFRVSALTGNRSTDRRTFLFSKEASLVFDSH
jgi:hypothetical protein